MATPNVRSVRGLSLLLAATLACGDGSTGPQPVASVDVSPTAVTLAAGQTTSLAGTPRDGAGNALTDLDVIWTSGAPSIASVDSSGSVTGLSAGTATITATAEGVHGSSAVTVLPPRVATILVAPVNVSILPGDTLRLTATARDAQSNVVAGPVFAWGSDNVSVATIDANGLVTGRAPGAATLYATSSGVSGSVDAVVVDPNAPRILAVTPAELVEGQAATLRGRNFHPVAATNVVTIDGVRAIVRTATDSTLAISVPALNCRPRHLADISVTVTGASGRFGHPARPATSFQLAIGQMALLQTPSGYCLQFAATTTDEQYVFGVQSIAESSSSLSSVQVVSDADDGVSAATPPATLPVAAPATDSPTEELPFALAWRAREAEAMRREIESLRDIPRPVTRPALAPPALIPGNVTVGTQVTLRYPDLDFNNTCSNYIEIQGTVRFVSVSGIWVSDNANPTDGYNTADYQALGNKFETDIYSNQTRYFGLPDDADGNGRVVMVVTKEVNDDQIGGIVPSANLVPRSTCPGSNEGEYFFMFAADPTGVHQLGPVSLDTALGVAPAIIGHELVHNIHLSRRFAAEHAFWDSWSYEGQATLGEEVLGHALNTGRGPGQNYGWSIVRNTPVIADRAWYYDNIRPLFLYFGWSPASGYDPTAPGSTKRQNAPEACTWLDTPSGANAGSCSNRGSLVYGVTWSFLRWLSDHYGPTFPGGESEMHKRWIDGPLDGFASIEALVGQPIEELLAHWAASLYLDDRVSGLNRLLTLPSYNLVNIESNVVPEARLTPRARGFADFAQSLQVRGGSSAYFLVSGANRPSTAIRMRSATGGFLDPSVQVWVVRTR